MKPASCYSLVLPYGGQSTHQFMSNIVCSDAGNIVVGVQNYLGCINRETVVISRFLGSRNQIKISGAIP